MQLKLLQDMVSSQLAPKLHFLLQTWGGPQPLIFDILVEVRRYLLLIGLSLFGNVKYVQMSSLETQASPPSFELPVKL